MAFWRVWAVLLGSSLMIGQTIRSWGQGLRLFSIFCIDCGHALRQLLWKTSDLSTPASSNIDIRLLTGLIGLAFASSLMGLVASIRLAGRSSSR